MRCAHRTTSWLAILGAMVFLTVGCGKSIGQTIDDATITTRVKTALMNEPNVAALSIDVDTFQGVVTLSGRVKSPDEASRAMSAAQRIGGVKDVKSTLQVIPG